MPAPLASTALPPLCHPPAFGLGASQAISPTSTKPTADHHRGLPHPDQTPFFLSPNHTTAPQTATFCSSPRHQPAAGTSFAIFKATPLFSWSTMASWVRSIDTPDSRHLADPTRQIMRLSPSGRCALLCNWHGSGLCRLLQALPAQNVQRCWPSCANKSKTRAWSGAGLPLRWQTRGRSDSPAWPAPPHSGHSQRHSTVRKGAESTPLDLSKRPNRIGGLHTLIAYCRPSLRKTVCSYRRASTSVAHPRKKSLARSAKWERDTVPTCPTIPLPTGWLFIPLFCQLCMGFALFQASQQDNVTAVCKMLILMRSWFCTSIIDGFRFFALPNNPFWTSPLPRSPLRTITRLRK